MNFILCDESCLYQKDGVCCLENVTTADITNDERCCFFVGKEVTDRGYSS